MLARLLCFVLPLMIAATLVAAEPLVIEAESAGEPGDGAVVYRDAAASGGKAMVLPLAERGSPDWTWSGPLPRGEYEAVYYVQAKPLDTNHGLSATFRAGSSDLTLRAANFSAVPGYQPFAVRFTHPGGPVTLRFTGSGSSGYDGMRAGQSADEKEATDNVSVDNGLADMQMDTSTDLGGGLDDDLGGMRLEAEPELKNLAQGLLVLACDRVEIRTLRTAPAVVQKVDVDKIHYKPGETVQATVILNGEPGRYTLVARDISELDASREVYNQAVELAAGTTTVTFAFPLPGPEFGHELRVALRQGDTELHAASEYFGCGTNVYRMGITGSAAGQDKRELTAEKAAAIMQANKAKYANYFEVFAWGPCDYSELTPDTEIFFSGQTQYPGSITGFKNLLAEAHRVGVKGISYGKSSAASLEGFRDWRQYPELYSHGAGGPTTEAYSTFYLERMIDNDYNLHAKPIDGGWQHWASLWTNMGPEATDHGADELIASAKMFGWDGVRWDGHFHNQMARFKAKVNAELPDYVHGYNIAFANPGNDMFLPPAGLVEDFHECAKDHGLMMDESARDWSHTNYSPGTIYPFYKAMAREADYIKRVGGLPLYITFDMASPQDAYHCVIAGLAAGERYTYMTSPGGSRFGDLPKWLTRYAAFVWDDTARLAKPADVLTVTTPELAKSPQKPAGLWWDETCWLRQLPDGRQQLLVNLVNPPNYVHFNDRVQTPSRHVRDVTVSLKVPAGMRLVRAAHLSPDLVEGHRDLDVRDGGTVTLEQVDVWSIVCFELAATDGELAWPAFPLTTPVEDAAKVLAEQQDAADKAQAQRAAASIDAPKQVPYYGDYENDRNTDAELKDKWPRPKQLAITRDGVLDVYHARGAFSWFNPIESAVAMASGGRYTPSWVDRVGFKLKHAGDNGQMDDFVEGWRDLYAQDVVVVDNVHVWELGRKNRNMLEQFVADGGGLIVFGGYFNLSMGADRNTNMEAVLPVRIKSFMDMGISDGSGFPLKPETGGPLAGLDWSGAPVAMRVDQSRLTEDAQVFARVGEHPAIVGHSYGKGRVIVVLMNSMGDFPQDAQPYWEWAGYSRLLAECLRWVAPDAGQMVAPVVETRELDPKHAQPDLLMLEAMDMESDEFTKRLASARHNMIDTETARMVLETALTYRDKVSDVELLQQVAETAAPFMDQSFAPLATQLTKDTLSYNRAAGYRVLGLTGDRSKREMLERALRDEDQPDVRREILLALGRIGDPASARAVTLYVSGGAGDNTLLALTVLYRMGDADALAKALPAYEASIIRSIRLKSGKKSLLDTLYGGTSFKLTPQQRRIHNAELATLKKLEAAIKHDQEFFRESLKTLDDNQLRTIVTYLAGTESRHLTPLAYQVLAPLPTERVTPLKPLLADAKVANIRLLAD